MGAAKNLIDKKVLRDLTPLNALSTAHLDEISRKAVITDVRAGRYIFKKGDRDYQSVYLLDGKIELLGDSRDVVSEIRAGSEAARHPLAHKQPRQLSARAVGNVTIACIDSSLLDVLLTWDESSGYDVVEIDSQEDDDWMTRMLQSQAFLQLPPSNIHQLLMRLETIHAAAGEAIVRQGDDGDYFYIVKSGRLSVSRKASSRSKEVALAELGEGACFGEEALVSGTKRNASVTMLTDGCLMRLAQADFNELLRTSLVHEIDFQEAQKLIAEGAKWLDVRLPGELENQAIKGAVNLPLSALRDQVAALNDEVAYIVCCDTGRRSAAGAFVLSQNGFTVYTLKNGLMDMPDDMLTHTRAAAAGPGTTREAEIIQFEADAGQQTSTESEADHTEPRPGTEVDSERLAKLNAELEILTRQLAESEAEAANTNRERAEAHTALEHLQLRNESLEEDLRRTRRECDDLEAKLIKNLELRQSEPDDQNQHVDSLEQKHQASAKRIRDLEEELERVRDDYQQLGQRASALGGERDSVAKDLDKARKEIHSLEEQLNTQLKESLSKTSELEHNLSQAEETREVLSASERSAREQLNQEQERRKELENSLGELQQAYQDQENRLQAADQKVEQAQAEKSTFATNLDERTRELDALGEQLSQAQQREQGLHEQLQSATSGAEETLLQIKADAAEAQEALNRRIEELRADLSARDEQLAGQDTRTSDLEQKLAEAGQELEALSARERSSQEELQRAQDNIDGAQTDLHLAVQQAEELRHQLAEFESKLKISEQQRLDLESKLTSVTKGFESDIASARGALSRSQDENENVKREQIRLMDAVRKAEARLVDARNDHEVEIHRLRKELKETAGESSAGLAAELEAVHAQLKQAKSQREELEIQLGSRSEQLEAIRAELEKTNRRFEQAQQSAREAEQQLVEANQASSEEMTVRLNAEQAVQNELREECDRIIAERDGQQENVRTLTQEVDQLRSMLQSAETGLSEKDKFQQELVEVRQVLQRAEQERDRTADERQQLQMELNQLRAEAEVTRGLVDMGPGGESDHVLREQLADARRNVEIAVKLRSESEARVEALQQDLERMAEELELLHSGESSSTLMDEMPRLDAADPDVSAFLDAVSKHNDEEDSSFVEDEPEPDQGRVQSTPLLLDEVAESMDASNKPRWVLYLAGLVIVGLLITGAVVWLNHQPTPESPEVSMPNLISDEPGRAVHAPVVGAVDVTEYPDRPGGDSVQPVERGIPEAAELPSATSTADEVKPVDQVVADSEQQVESLVSLPVTVPEDVLPVLERRIATFRDRLSAGGQGPDMIDLQAGTFEMGSGSISLNFDERPRHEVDLKRFAVSKYEITFEQYERFASASGRSRPADSGWGRGTRPVINVSWKDAVAYTRWLSEQTGHKYRLPTEAEWEFAARAGSTGRYWWGSDPVAGKANCFDCGSPQAGRSTAPVGTFEANAFDLYDMAGNVREWVQDCHAQNYDAAPNDGSAIESEGCTVRVVRGGGFRNPSDNLRSSARDSSALDQRFNDLGFRVARDF